METANISENETQSQVSNTDESTTARPQAENQQTADGETLAEEPFLEIKYMKEMRGLSRDEAKNYAEIGMHYQGVRKKLERFATLKGMTAEEFVNGLEAAEDEAYRSRLMEKFGGDEETVASMMELYSLKKQQTLDNALQKKRAQNEAEEHSVNARIAEEFTKMKGDFPELTEFAALPAEVKKAALMGKALPYAYLEYKHNEAKKITAAKENARTAAEKSTGTAANPNGDFTADDERRYLGALWGK